jgi:hypothetical protein
MAAYLGGLDADDSGGGGLRETHVEAGIAWALSERGEVGTIDAGCLFAQPRRLQGKGRIE